MNTIQIISFFSSIATLILFLFYFIGRIITVLSVQRMWKDKVYLYPNKESNYGIVDDIFYDDYSYEHEDIVYGILVSKEGIRDIKIYNVKVNSDGLYIDKGELLYKRDFLNIDEAIAFHIEPGELYPTLIVEYVSFDFMKIRFEWRDNLKNGVFSEMVEPKHSIKSFLYYLLR